MAKLNHKVEIYVPVNNDEQAKIAFGVLEVFAVAFDHVSVAQVLGSQIAKDGSLVAEDVNVIYAYTDNVTEGVREMVVLEAIKVKRNNSERTVTIVIDGIAEYI